MADVKVEANAESKAVGDEDRPAQIDPSVWNEEQLEQSLMTLKEMYIQLRDLRSTIPKLVAPLVVQQPSRLVPLVPMRAVEPSNTDQPAAETLFRNFKSAATTANDDLKQFRGLVESAESQKIFDYAKESRAENPKDITPWRVTDHPDWYDRDV